MKERHWTHDAELIERFVLQKMNPEERNEMEDHLRICEVCKRAVRNEQLLVAGIRRSGREQFKSALAAKLASIPTAEKKTPWPKILSAAAVIVVLLTVGIYNRWFETTKETAFTPTAEQLKQSDETAAGEFRKDESLPAFSERDANVPYSSAQPATKSSTAEDIRRVAASPRSAVPSPSMATKKDESPTDERLPVAAAEAAGAAATEAEMRASAETFWIEGTVLESDNAVPRGEAAREEKKVEFSKGRADSPVGATAIANTIVLHQQTILTLPAEQQRVRQPTTSAIAAGKRVMTKLERVGAQTQMTFYFDSLVDEREWANATIETPRRDSLIVNLPHQRIGYRLPAAVDARQLRISK